MQKEIEENIMTICRFKTIEFMFNLLDILRLDKEKRAENPPNKEVEESDQKEENNC